MPWAGLLLALSVAGTAQASCRKAGSDGLAHGDWNEYQCKRVYNDDQYRYFWWLCTR